jgi:hypothetical protein
MAFVIADRVRETSTTIGTGNFTLAGALTGYQTFDSALDTGDTTYYAIADQGGANWEVGIGTFTSPATLARTTILSSSNGGSVVTFGAGTKDVFISLPASKTNTVEAGNLTFASTGQRITGDFSNATIANRTMFQSNTTNGDTRVGALPNGTATGARFELFNNSDTTNSSRLSFVMSSTEAAISSAINGSGTYLPILMYTSAAERMRIDSSGNVLIGTTSAIEKLTVAGNARMALIYGNRGSGEAVTAGGFGLTIDGSIQAQIVSPASNSMAFYTNGTERARIDSSGNLLFNSGYGSVATAYGCRAWVNFNGSGTVAIRASGNVTSITDNGTGDYTVNFTNAMPDANYVVLGLGYAGTGDNSTLRGIEQRGAPTTGSARIMTFNGINTSAYDGDYVNVAIFR